MTPQQTNNKYKLSDTQIAQYEKDGYVIAPGILDRDEIELYKTRAREIALGDYPEEAKKRIMKDVRIAKGIIPPPEDIEKGLWKFTNPDRFDETFRNYIATPRLIDA